MEGGEVEGGEERGEGGAGRKRREGGILDSPDSELHKGTGSKSLNL